MWKKNIFKACRWAWYLTAAFIIILALFLSAARIAVPILSRHTAYFEKILSQALSHPVHISTVGFGWRGFDPELRFQNIAILNNKGLDNQSQKIITSIKQFDVGISLFSSLWHRKILPSEIQIAGTNLDLYQNSDLSWQLLESSATNNSGDSKNFLKWMLTQSHIRMRDINLTVHYANGGMLPIRDLQLILIQKQHPTIAGNFKVGVGKVSFVWQWLSDEVALPFNAKLYLNVHQVAFSPSLLPTLTAFNPQTWPRVNGTLNGELWLLWKNNQLTAAQTEIKNTTLHIMAPGIYNNGITLPNVGLALRWQRQLFANRLTVSQFYFGLPNQVISAGFQLRGPEVIGNLSVQDMSILRDYIPNNISPGAQDWLSHAFMRGSITNAQFSWRGFTKQFYMQLPVKNVTLAYSPKWPVIDNLNADLFFHNKSLLIQATHGMIMGSTLDQATCSIPDLTQSNIFIDGLVTGPMQFALNFLNKSPLPLAPFVTAWHADGNIQTQIRLNLHLHDKKDPVETTGTVNLLQVALKYKDTGFAWNNISGVLNFENNKLSAKSVQASMNNALTNLIINTNYVHNKPIYDLQFSGMYPIQLPHAHGVVPYHAVMQLTLADRIPNITLDGYSSLVGLVSDFPEPFAKLASAAWPAEIKLAMPSNKPSDLQIKLKHKLALHAQFTQQPTAITVSNAQVSIGENAAPVMQKTQGVFLRVHLPQLNLDDWLALKSSLNSGPMVYQYLINWQAADIKISKLIYQQHLLTQNSLQLMHKNAAWNGRVQNNLIKGNFVVPDNKVLAWNANFDYCNWPVWWKTSNKSTESFLPTLNFTCQAFSYHGRNYGVLNLNTVKTSSSLKITKFALTNSQFELNTQGNWTSAPITSTKLSGDLITNDLGAMLVTFGMGPIVSKGIGQINFDLYWPTAPSKISPATMSGKVNFNFDSGRIMKIDKQTETNLGLGRILNLLSLQSLPTTVFSGFQSLGAKGFEFYSLKGDVTLNQGKGKLNSLSLVGPVAWVTAAGAIDFSQKTYDLKLQVIPNITSSVPLIVALASGPIAGAIAFVVDRIFGSEIGKAAEKTLTVKGSWDHPSVLKLPKPNATSAG